MFFCKDKKVPHGSFYEDEQFLDSSTSVYLTLFESNFVDITLDNYSQVKTTNSKALLFIVASSTVLIEYEVFDSKRETIKVAMLKLWPVYCVLSIQIYLFSIRQILQSGLRVKGDKSGSTFHDKSGNTVLLATSNPCSNI